MLGFYTTNIHQNCICSNTFGISFQEKDDKCLDKCKGSNQEEWRSCDKIPNHSVYQIGILYQ